MAIEIRQICRERTRIIDPMIWKTTALICPQCRWRLIGGLPLGAHTPSLSPRWGEDGNERGRDSRITSRRYMKKKQGSNEEQWWRIRRDSIGQMRERENRRLHFVDQVNLTYQADSFHQYILLCSKYKCWFIGYAKGSYGDGELFRNMNTGVLSEPILLLIIHQLEKLSIY